MGLTQEQIHYWMWAVFGTDRPLKGDTLMLSEGGAFTRGTALSLGGQVGVSVFPAPQNRLCVMLTDNHPHGPTLYERWGLQVESDLVGMLFEAHWAWVKSWRKHAKSTPFTRPGFGPFHGTWDPTPPPAAPCEFDFLRDRKPLGGPDPEEEERWGLQ